MAKFIHGFFTGIDIAHTLARVALLAAGAFFLVELTSLAVRYGALIQYAMRGHAVY